MNTPQRRQHKIASGVLLLITLVGCGATEENPLNVNAVGARQPTTPTSESPTPSSTSTPLNDAASFISESLGDDPLNIRADGATLCGVQPQDSTLQYTIMLHNPTLETFTFDSVDLVDPQGLTKTDVKIARANREGHGNHGAATTPAAEHEAGGHTPSPTPTPSPSSDVPVAPVPAVGYRFKPDQHINIVVSVALDEGVIRGTADDVLVSFSSPDKQFSVPHDLNITIDRSTCA